MGSSLFCREVAINVKIVLIKLTATAFTPSRRRWLILLLGQLLSLFLGHLEPMMGLAEAATPARR